MTLLQPDGDARPYSGSKLFRANFGGRFANSRSKATKHSIIWLSVGVTKFYSEWRLQQFREFPARRLVPEFQDSRSFPRVTSNENEVDIMLPVLYLEPDEPWQTRGNKQGVLPQSVPVTRQIRRFNPNL